MPMGEGFVEIVWEAGNLTCRSIIPAWKKIVGVEQPVSAVQMLELGESCVIVFHVAWRVNVEDTPGF